MENHNTQMKFPGRKRSCLAFSAWTVLLLFALILVLFFVMSSLFDLGVWEEFWELFK